MRIGFGLGDFWMIEDKGEGLAHHKLLEHFKIPGANAMEISFGAERIYKLLLSKDAGHRFDDFEYLSMHAPGVAWQGNPESHHYLQMLAHLCEKFPIQNIVVHPDTVVDREVFLQYPELPISIENMDNLKTFGKSVSDIQNILDKYPFGLTLDLQHCYTNDPTMQLAAEFHKTLGDRLVQYHISAYDPEELHVTLYNHNQDLIIEHLEQKNIPIIIESCEKYYAEAEIELNYILRKI